jgi:hypothetical protein
MTSTMPLQRMVPQRACVSAFGVLRSALRHRQRQAAVRVITVAHATADHPATAVEGGPNYQPEA